MTSEPTVDTLMSERRTTPIKYSVVVPVYGNAATIPALLDRLQELSAELDAPMEAVFVVDGSPDGSLLVLRKLLPDVTFESQLVTHSRNFGSFAAIRTGFAVARGEFVAAMAADLQEPAELVQTFFSYLASGEYDVAVGTRAGRADSRTTMLLSRAFWSPVSPLGPSRDPGRRRRHLRVYAAGRVATRRAERIPLEPRRIALLARVPQGRGALQRLAAPVRARAAGRCGARCRYFLDSVFSFTDVPDHAARDRRRSRRCSDNRAGQHRRARRQAHRCDRPAGLHAPDARDPARRHSLICSVSASSGPTSGAPTRTARADRPRSVHDASRPFRPGVRTVIAMTRLRPSAGPLRVEHRRRRHAHLGVRPRAARSRHRRPTATSATTSSSRTTSSSATA